MIKKIIFPLFVLCMFSFSDGEDRPGNVRKRFFDIANSFPESCVVFGSTDSKEIALSFDDGPSEITEGILDLLDELEVKVTFFWKGENLEEQHVLVRRAIFEGHLVGNHSWDHTKTRSMTEEEFWSSQVERTQREFKRLFDFEPQYFRPPYGGITDGQIIRLMDEGMRVGLWTLSTFDWDKERNDLSSMVDEVNANLHNGAVVLMHDGDARAADRVQLDAIREIIGLAREQGYSFVTLDDFYNINTEETKCEEPFPGRFSDIGQHGKWAFNHYWKKIEEFKVNRLGEGEIVFVGDSLTQGGGDWSEMLGVPGVRNRGIAGDTTLGVLARIDELVCARPSKVFLMIGTNDMSQDISSEDICSNIVKIAQVLRSRLPETEVYLQTVFPSRGDKGEIDDKIRATNRLLRKAARLEAFVLIDTYGAVVGKDGHLLQSLSRNNLHLNAEGYLVWASLLSKYISLGGGR